MTRKKIPDDLSFRYFDVTVLLSLVDEGFDGACPICLGTLTIPQEAVRTHRDGTFSLTQAVTCGACQVAITVDHSVADPDADAEEEPNYWVDD